MKDVIDLISADLYVEVISNEPTNALLKLKNGVVVEVYMFYDGEVEMDVFGICDESGAGTESCDGNDLNEFIESHWAK
ncbi:MAG: hypothetical protein ACRC3J_05045 [Culicoidibacterales bacterium]